MNAAAHRAFDGANATWRPIRWIALLVVGMVTLFVLTRTPAGPRVQESAVTEEYPPESLQAFAQRHPVPPLLHTIWMCNPLRAYALTALDSAVHYMPGVLLKLHILVPAGATQEDVDGFRKRFEWQLQPLVTRREGRIEIVMHDNIEAELENTPLGDLGITQAHLGGTIEILRQSQADRDGSAKDRAGSSHAGHHSMSHASDLLRSHLLLTEGGIYFDSDVVFLRDVRPVIEESGPFAICQKTLDALTSCGMSSFFAATPPGHPYMKHLVNFVREAIQEWTPDRVFPYTSEMNARREREKAPGWSVLMAGFGHAWRIFSKGTQPEDKLQEKRRGGNGMTYEYEGSYWTGFGLRYWSLHNWDADTLRRPPSTDALRDRLSGYIIHLWEKSKDSKNNTRALFVEYLRKNTLISAIHRIICMAYCDHDELEKYSTLEEYDE